MFKKVLSLLLAISVLCGTALVFGAASSDEVSFENGGNTSVRQISEGHSLSFRFIAAASFDTVSVSVSSMGNNIGNLTVSLYKYSVSYEKTLKSGAVASNEFVDFMRSDVLSLYSDCEAGDYLIVVDNPVEKVGCYVSSGRGNAQGLLYEDGFEIEGTLCGSIHFTEGKTSYFTPLNSSFDLTKKVTTPEEITYGDNDNVVTRNVYSSSWTCTDGLGRTLPTGENKDGKERIVAMAYWTWSGDFSKQYTPRNVENIILENPEAKNDYYHEVWKELTPVQYFWDEPLFGYYSVTDKWVIRKHAELLAAAGVDVIFFDNTNGAATWREGYRTVFEVFAEAREDGVMCPAISFTFGFAPSEDQRTQLREIYLDIFRQDKFRELWFYRDGKPLMMGYPDSLHSDDELDNEIREFFTFREPLAKCNGNEQTKPGQWCWLDTYPQHVYYDEKNNLEMIPVGTAINWNENGMTAFNGENVMGRAWTHDKGMDTSEDAVLYGAFLAEQFEYAIEKDPDIIFVVGWNEWVAGHYEEWCGVKGAFPDEYNDMYSRDIEPSNGMLKDNYYYELCYYIRKYKGSSGTLPVSDMKTIDVNGDRNQWDDVYPAFYAYQNNTGDRNSAGYVGEYYQNTTGRNDIVLSKVARDESKIYFYVETKDALSDPSGDSWMMLFLDTEDSSNSWEGYEYVLNRTSPEADGIVLEKATGNGWEFTKICNVGYSVQGNVLMIEIPLSVIGITSEDYTLNFKWADNTGIDGDVMVFYRNGDVAPLGRFNYCYSTLNKHVPDGDNSGSGSDSLLPVVIGIVAALVAVFAVLFVLVLIKNKKEREK